MSVKVLGDFLRRYEALTPSEFEDMVAEWLRCKGYFDVKVTGRSGDMGRDVIGVNPQGIKVYIEVKFHEKAIGRPVIQKLHSIMSLHKITKGMVVTSSAFSKGAIEYAQATSIDLVEGSLFEHSCQDLASKKTTNAPECVKCAPSKILEGAISAMPGVFFFFPKLLDAYVKKVTYCKPVFLPNVLVNFTAHEEFHTKGIYQDLIHCINYENYWIGLRAGDIYSTMPFPTDTCSLKDLAAEWEAMGLPITTPSFSTDSCAASTLRTVVKKFLTKQVAYYGRNNQRYVRECSPSEKNVQILDYIPFWDVYVTATIECGGTLPEFAFLNTRMLPHKNPKRIVCDECEKAYPVQSTRICRHCGKLVCNTCSGRQRYLLLFRRYWCNACLAMVATKEYDKKKSDRAKSTRAEFKAWLKKKPSNVSPLVTSQFKKVGDSYLYEFNPKE